MKPADAGIHVENRVRADRVVVAQRQALAACIFSATVFAETCTERILGETQQFEVAEATEDRLLFVDGLVSACYIFVCVAASTGVLQKIENRPGTRGIRN